MKKKWITNNLGEICEIKGGKRLPKGEKVSSIKTPYPYLRVTDFDKLGSVDVPNIKYINEEVHNKISNYIITDKDLFISIAGTIGVSGIVPKTLSGSNLTENACRLILGKQIDLDYLYYFTLSKSFEDQVNSFTKTTAQPKLALTRIRKITINYPKALKDQVHIAKTLDEKFEVVEKLKNIAEEQLLNARELFESRLDEVFVGIFENTDSVTMSDIYDVRDGTHDSPKYQATGYALVTSKNLKNGKLILDNVKLISKEDYKSICKRSRVNVGDLLFAMIGTIGNPVVVSEEPDYAIKNMALFKVPEKQNSNFLRYYLMTRFVINKMTKEAKGATQQFVGLGYLRAFPIPKVDYSKQKKIVRELDELSEKTRDLEIIFQRKITDLKELKKSYLHEAFSGNL